MAPVAGLVAFAVALLGAGLVTADWGLRTAESAELLARVERSEAQMTVVQEAVTEAYAAYEASDQGADARQRFEARLRDIAAAGAADIAHAGIPVARMRIPYWHGDLRRARDAYLAHNAAWVAYLLRAQDDPGEFVREQVEVNSTFLVSERLMRSAVPVPTLPSIADRLDAIYAEPAPADGETESVSLAAA